MVRKFFPYDKNYLLEEAQLLLQAHLLDSMVESVKVAYEQSYNPLGIPDALTLKVRNFQITDMQLLSEFYLKLAGIYRFKHGDNQLKFMWDGVDQGERYRNEWIQFFNEQTARFCRSDLFIRAVLDLTVFTSENRNAQLAESKMNQFMLQAFEVKLHKSRGIVAVA